ncbi:MAG: glucose-6-phosphate isomerase family protein [Candidatus Hydrothermarchaeales archaeon]
MEYTKPYRSLFGEDGILEPFAKKIERRLGDMEGFFADEEAYKSLLKEDPLIYTVYEMPAPAEEGQFSYATTILYPGKVGEEYFMTKGHYHAKRGTGEIYVGISGCGVLLMQTQEGEVKSMEIVKGTVAYVPPYWAHRTINTGGENFVFLAIYPADASHDYGSIAEEGFAKILVERDGRPRLIGKDEY